MKIRNLMTVDIPTVPADTDVRDALRMMRSKAVDCLLVDPVLAGPGVATAVDLEAAADSTGLPPEASGPPVVRTVGSVSLAPLPRLEADTSLAVARDILDRHACSHLLVIEGEEILGVVSAVSIDKALNLLRNHRIFAGVSLDAMAQLLRIATFRDILAGAVLLKEGDEDADLYVLDRGLLSVHTKQAGRIARIRPGEMVGELEIFGGPNAATVRAAEDSRVLMIERARMLVLLSAKPPMAAAIYTNITELLSERLRQANRFLFLRGIARHRMLVLTVLAALGLVCVLFTLGFGVASENPKFCMSCHYMQPYYDSWAMSTHKEVRCAECHSSYGFQGVMRGKITGIAMVTRYLTRTYDPKPEAEVSDSSCIRSGCHSQPSQIQTMTSLPDIRFPHPAHRDSLGVGTQLRCTSCHHHGRQNTHFSVDTRSCYLCHFMRKSPAEVAGQCRACHKFAPQEEMAMQIDHAALPERLSCTYCHESVVQGDGAVEEFRCYSCHLDPDLSTPADEQHRIHIQERDVACFECHAEIRHEGGTGPILAQNCLSCHPDHHAAQEKLYLGHGGRDVLETPGIMSYFHVECTGCHRRAESGEGPRVPDSAVHRTAAVTDEVCLSCHDVGYRDKLRMWQATIDSATQETQQVLRQVEEALASAPGGDDPTRQRARELYQDAAYNYALVMADNSRGVHNFKYTRDLLSTAQNKLQRALDLLGG